MWKCWVRTTQAPVLDRPPQLAGLALCGAQILFFPYRTAAFPFERKISTSGVLTHGTARKEHFCGCWSGQKCGGFAPPWPALPCPPHPPVPPVPSPRTEPAAEKEHGGVKHISEPLLGAVRCRTHSDCFTSPSCWSAKIYPAPSRACARARPGFCSRRGAAARSPRRPWTGRVSPTDGTAFLSYFAQSLKTFR